MTLIPTMCELWSQKELSQVGGREALTTPTPLELRPVTVSGFLYNLGAGTRFVDVIRWCTNLVAQICGGRHSRTSHSKVCMDCVVGNGRRRGRSCHGGNLTRPSSSTRGELWKAMNGVVQGCSLSLVTVAYSTCLWMDGMNQQVPQIKATTMVDDRRLYAVGTEQFRILQEAVEYTKTIDDEVVTSSTAKIRWLQHHC